MKRKLLALLVFCGFSFSFAVDTLSVTMQNGLDNYDGCIDATISSQSASNMGAADKLNVKYEKCKS